MTTLITDHSYRPDRQGQWFTGRCDKCGEPRSAHAPVDPARCPECGNPPDVCLCPEEDAGRCTCGEAWKRHPDPHAITCPLHGRGNAA